METLTEAPGSTRAADAEAADADEAGVRRQRRLRLALIALGVLVPFALCVHNALTSHLAFDGAMNLQVAQNFADGEGWGRDYGGWRDFPKEVQTSGAFLFVATGAIWVLGQNQLAYQFANLLFALVLLCGISWLVRPSLLARVLAPGLVLLAVPAVAFLGFGGLGEIPVAALGVVSLGLLVTVIDRRDRPYRRVALAFALGGIALTIKAVAVAILPVLLLGLVLVVLQRPELAKRKLALATTAFVAAPALYELFRLAVIGAEAYRRHWAQQFDAIGFQSGIDRTGDGGGGPLTKLADHVHLLAESTDAAAPLLVAYLAVPFAALAWLLLRHRRTLKAFLADTTNAVTVLLAAYGGLYLAWWFVVTPTERAWLRRVLIGLLVVNLLYALLVVIFVRQARDAAPRRQLRSLPAGAVALLVVVGALFGAPKVWRGLDSMVTRNPQVDAIEDAADAIRNGAPGLRYWGEGWWSAPVVSLVADVPLRNMGDAPPCTLDAERDVLVWDIDAQAIVGRPSDSNGDRVIEKIADFDGFVELWSVGGNPDSCPPAGG